jgi:excisionase family DNA binding protein
MQLLTYKELGQSLSLSVRYLQKCVKQGNLEYVRFGRAIRFHPEVISNWVKQHTQTTVTSQNSEDLASTEQF